MSLIQILLKKMLITNVKFSRHKRRISDYSVLDLRRNAVQPAILLPQRDLQKASRLLHGARVRVLGLSRRFLASRRVPSPSHAAQYEQPGRHASERLFCACALFRRLWRNRSGTKVTFNLIYSLIFLEISFILI